VIWVEPVPEVFSILEQNLNGYDEQLAVKACVSEFDDERVVFKVSNNNGASSSMFNFKLHKVAFPEVQYIDEFPTTTISLPTLLKKLNLEIVDFQAIVIDAQGAELQILRGAGDLLKKVKYVKVEVADYEAYEGGCTNSEIIDFLLSNKFRILSKDLIARNDCIGNYYDYVFKNDSTSQSLRFKT
jgi:FkbM family methyltransferase